jgi:hypothetical protein
MTANRTALIALSAVVAVLATAVTVLGAVVFAAAGGALGGGCNGDGGPGGGSQQLGTQTWSAEQMTNAQTIVQHAVDAALPKRAAVIALSAAIVESRLENVPYGHADSLGLFQQRPSQGWGTPEQLLNPSYATAAFYEQLLQVPGWDTLPPGVAAQQVQRSAFPDRYGPQEAPAADLVARLWVGPDNPVPLPRSPAADPAATPLVPSMSTALCPDQGESGVPLNPGVDPHQLPDGFTLPADPEQRAAVSFALDQVGKPYVFGAKGPDAFDCSGLTTAAWAAAGIGIPAGTVNQKLTGTAVTIGQIAPGDLVFIPGSLGSPTNPRHVGLYAGHGVLVSANDSRSGVVLRPLADWAGQIVTIRRVAGRSGERSTPSALTGAG